MSKENPWKGDPNSSPISHEEIAARFAEAFEAEFSEKHKEDDYCPHCVAVEALNELRSKLIAVDSEVAGPNFYSVLGLGIDSLIHKESDSDKLECVKALERGLEAGAESRTVDTMGNLFEFLTNSSSSNKP